MYFCTKCPPTINCVLILLHGRHRRATYVCKVCHTMYPPGEMRKLYAEYKRIIQKDAGHHKMEALDAKG